MIVTPEFLHHWKTELLIQRTGDPASPLMLIRLWGHCHQRKEWIFKGLSNDALKAICKWPGDAQELYKILIECRFIDKMKNAIQVHGWEEANLSLVKNWKNGIKGGRPLKNPDKTQRKPNHNPEVSQAKPNDNPKPTDRLNGLDRGEGNEETESPATAIVCF